MTDLVLGVSHRSAPMALLDALALSGEGVDRLTGLALAGDYVDGAMVLSTCNRLEIIADVKSFHGGLADLGSALVEVTGIDWQDLAHHVFVLFDDGATEHLLTLAAGLDSMAVGEAQILGQLRQTYSRAQEAGHLTGALSGTVQEALRVGKRAHAETELDSVAGSLLDTALVRAAEHIGPIETADVLIVGAGAMSGLVAATLARAGAGSITILNRTLERAERLAASVDGRAVEFTPEALPAEIAKADLVVSVIGARGTVIDADTITASLAHLEDPEDPAHTFLIDLALPFDVDPNVEEHPFVRMIGLEGLSSMFADTDYTASSGVVDVISRVRTIIREEMAALSAGKRARTIAPTVTALRKQAGAVVSREIEKLEKRLGDRVAEDDMKAIRRSLRQVATTLLHTPTVKVKELAADEHEKIDYAAALTMLFDLQRTPTAAAGSAAGSAEAGMLSGAGTSAAVPVPAAAGVRAMPGTAAAPGTAAGARAAEAGAGGLLAQVPQPAGRGTGDQGRPVGPPASDARPAPDARPLPDRQPSVRTASVPGSHYVAAAGESPVASHTLDVVEPARPSGRTIRLGTRRSQLARSQSTAVAQQLAAQTGLRVEIVEVVTEGDVNMTPLASFGGAGVFVSSVRSALLDGRVDIAVHSLKDLPTAAAPGISLAAVPPRVDPSDVLITRDGLTLAQLPAGAVIGTGSPRRAAQLRAARPDIEVTGVRGNVDTRIRHVTEGRLDAVVLAAAGVRRLGRLGEVTEVLDSSVMLPAPGQGALAVECRDADAELTEFDAELRSALSGLHDEASMLAVLCERAILARAEAGCSAPIGAIAHLEGHSLEVSGVLADEAGTLLRVTRRSPLPRRSADTDPAEVRHAAEALGAQVAEELLSGLGLDPARSIGANAPGTHLAPAEAAQSAEAAQTAQPAQAAETHAEPELGTAGEPGTPAQQDRQDADEGGGAHGAGR
ncbi:glutamyl-tRNA reductase [Brevibacterium album]|uniref:glutamyl-tRNA reductase n=1 Tax=Brevibacterium album TaxID=417948 RepID=UPI000408B8D2|nr:glutamyl-tRNA reductase [Brevibacterium album]